MQHVQGLLHGCCTRSLLWPETAVLAILCLSHVCFCFLSMVQWCGLAQEYAGCLPHEAAASPGSLGAWLYSCSGVNHAEEAALRVNLPGLKVQVSQSAACSSDSSCCLACSYNLALGCRALGATAKSVSGAATRRDPPCCPSRPRLASCNILPPNRAFDAPLAWRISLDCCSTL